MKLLHETVASSLVATTLADETLKVCSGRVREGVTSP